jgi:hypothetical protein
MKQHTRWWLACWLAMSLLGLARAQSSAPMPMPSVAMEGFSQTPAKSLEDFTGRALLIEFFAYW